MSAPPMRILAATLIMAVTGGRPAGLRRRRIRQQQQEDHRAGAWRTWPTGSPPPRRSSRTSPPATGDPRRPGHRQRGPVPLPDRLQRRRRRPARRGRFGVRSPASAPSPATNCCTPRRTRRSSTSSGRQTFSPRALELTADDGKQLAVPSDGWGQLLVYRKDLFAAAGLPAPDTYERIAAAAAKLNTGGVAGITAATAPGDVFTQQTFEHLALANNCQLTDDPGKVTLDSPQCVEAFRLLRRPDPHQLGQGRAGRRHHPGHLLRRQGGHADLVAVHPRRAGRAAQRRQADLPAVPGRPGVPREEQRLRHRDQGPERHRTGPVRRDQLLGRARRRRRPTRRSTSWSTCSATATRAGSACPPRAASRSARAPPQSRRSS